MSLDLNKKIKKKCTCGKEFEGYPRYDDWNPFDDMCSDCRKKDNWRFYTRLLQLEKFKCVKCGWKLKEKDTTYGSADNTLAFKCPCCGYRFELYVELYNDYY